MMPSIENKEFWENHIEKQKTSGLARSQYCREFNLNYHRFGYWLKRLSFTSSEFIPVKLQVPDTTIPHAVLCTIELRGRILKIHDLSALSFVIERLT